MKKVRNIKKLAMELNMEKVDLFTRVLELNEKYELNIDNYDDLEEWQCVLIRTVVSEEYAVRLLRKDKGFEGVYCYRTNPQYATVSTYIAYKNLNGKSTREIMDLVGDASQETIKGTQMVAFAMREAGYEPRLSYIGGKQRRLWFKEGQITLDHENLFNGVKDFVKWTSVEGKSLSEIMTLSNAPTTPQKLGMILRELGYESRIIRMDEDVQSRRWYKRDFVEPRVCDATTKLAQLDLNGKRMEEVQLMVEGMKSQHLGRILKDLGYECKITRKDGVQARRWYKADTVSFL